MKTMTKLATASLLGASMLVAAHASTQIGIVNEMKVFNNVPQGQQKIEALKHKLQTKEQGLVKQQKELASEIQAFQKNSVTMSKDDMAKQKAELEKKQMDFQKQVQAAQQEAAQHEQALTASFQTQIDAAIKEVATKGHYSMILSKQAVPYLASDAKNVNVTEEVIKQLKTDKKSK